MANIARCAITVLLFLYVSTAGANETCPPCKCEVSAEPNEDLIVNCTNRLNDSIPDDAIKPQLGSVYLLDGNKDLRLYSNVIQRLKSLLTLQLPNNQENFQSRFLQNATKLRRIICPDLVIKGIHEEFFKVDIDSRIEEINNLQVSYLPPILFHSVPKLKKLSFTTTQAGNLSADIFAGSKLLEHLHMTANHLSYVPASLFHTTADLTILKLDIDNVEVLNRNLLVTASKLNDLHITSSRLVLIEPFFYFELIEFSIQLVNVARLSYDLFPASTRFTNVKLSGVGNLTCNPNLTKTLVENLTIASCGLTNLADGCLFPIAKVNTMLNMSNNDMESLQLAGQSQSMQMTVLDLSWNAISQISETTTLPTRLRVLNLQHNKIQRLPNKVFEGLRSLKSVRLDHNLLTSLAGVNFKPIMELEHLDLSNNHLSILDSSQFSIFEQLVSVDFQANDIQHLEEGIFSSLELRSVNLASNKIQTVDVSFIGSDIQSSLCKRLETRKQYLSLNFTDNPIVCTCLLNSLLVACRKPAGEWRFTPQGHCYRPLPLRSRVFSLLHTSDICMADGTSDIVYPASAFVLTGTVIEVVMENITESDRFNSPNLGYNGSALLLGAYALPANHVELNLDDKKLHFMQNEQLQLSLNVSHKPKISINSGKLFIPVNNVHIMEIPIGGVASIAKDSIDIIGENGDANVTLKFNNQSMGYTVDCGTLILEKDGQKILDLNGSAVDVFDGRIILSTNDLRLESSLPISNVQFTTTHMRLETNDFNITLIPNSDLMAAFGNGTVTYGDTCGLALKLDITGEDIYVDESSVQFSLSLKNRSVLVRETLHGPVWINKTHAVVIGKNLSLSINSEKVSETVWNGTHLRHGPLTIAADGILLINQQSTSFINGSLRDVTLQRTTNSVFWNGSHLLVNSSTKGVDVYAIGGRPDYSETGLSFYDDGERLAVIDVGKSFPVFEDDTVTFGSNDNYKIGLLNPGIKEINNSHILITDGVRVRGVYKAHGEPQINVTHIVKRDSGDRTTAVSSIFSSKVESLDGNITVEGGRKNLRIYDKLIRLDGIPHYNAATGYISASKFRSRVVGTPHIYNESLIVFPPPTTAEMKWTVYLMDDKISLNHSLNGVMNFLNDSGSICFAMTLRGSLIINATGAIYLYSDQRVTAYIDTALFEGASYNISFDGLVVKIGDKLNIDCVNAPAIKVVYGVLTLTSSLQDTDCLVVKQANAIEIREDHIYAKHHDNTFGEYAIGGNLSFEIGKVEISDHVPGVNNSMMAFPNTTIHVSTHGLVYVDNQGKTVMRYHADSPMILEAGRKAKYGSGSSAEIISSLTYNQASGLILATSNNTLWGQINGPLSLRVTSLALVVLSAVSHDVLARYTVPICGNISIKEPLPKSAGVLSLYNNGKLGQLEDLFLELSVMGFTLETNEIVVGMHDNSTMVLVPNSAYKLVLYQKRMLISDLDCAYLFSIADERNTILVQVKNQTAYISGALSHFIKTNFTGVLIKSSGILVYEESAATIRMKQVEIALDTSIPHFNGTAIVFTGNETPEAVYLLDAQVPLKPVLEVSDNQILHFYDSVDMRMDISDMWTETVLLNATHLVYGSRGESAYAPGNAYVSSQAITIVHFEEELLTIKPEESKMVKISIMSNGCQLFYNNLNLSVPGVILEPYMTVDGYLVIPAGNGSREIIIKTETNSTVIGAAENEISFGHVIFHGDAAFIQSISDIMETTAITSTTVETSTSTQSYSTTKSRADTLSLAESSGSASATITEFISTANYFDTTETMTDTAALQTDETVTSGSTTQLRIVPSVHQATGTTSSVLRTNDANHIAFTTDGDSTNDQHDTTSRAEDSMPTSGTLSTITDGTDNSSMKSMMTSAQPSDSSGDPTLAFTSVAGDLGDVSTSMEPDSFVEVSNTTENATFIDPVAGAAEVPMDAAVVDKISLEQDLFTRVILAVSLTVVSIFVLACVCVGVYLWSLHNCPKASYRTHE